MFAADGPEMKVDYPDPFDLTTTPAFSRSFTSVLLECRVCRSSDPPIDIPWMITLGNVEWSVSLVRRDLMIVLSSRRIFEMAITQMGVKGRYG